MKSKLEQEANSIENLLKGKVIVKVFRPRSSEVCIECSDGTRFFASIQDGNGLDFSITGGTDLDTSVAKITQDK